jgi:DNA-binding SARP family transcriptional activator/tetratricopeptide (TPR) repeat protein
VGKAGPSHFVDTVLASFAGAMEFRILGPLEVLDEGHTVDVGAAKQRALLAVLLLNANRVVSSDRLIEALWGERAPGTAQKALQVYVSQLRKALGRDRILTRAPGYEIRVEEGELDLDRFETLVADGRLVEALRLPRGTPLADFAYEPFAQGEIARLEELVLACIEQRIEGDLASGRHVSLVGELDALVQEHPLRERLRAQLMLALYRSGRQAEALASYQAARTLLSDELGLEPSAELKELQRRILVQDAELDLTVPSSARVDEPTLAPRAEPDGVRLRHGRKTVTVLSCDLTASGAELDPESLRHLTARGFDELLPVLEGHGATVERSIGGAVSAIFGIPVVHEDDALRAARAAVEMRDRLASLTDELVAQWGSQLELRVGIGTGEVLVDAASDRPFATGQPVQMAIRLQQRASPDEVLLDERTKSLLSGAAEFETRGDHSRLVDVRPLVIDTGPRFDVPMVGRERERRRLQDAFEQALGDRSCQLFTIIGPPGVGKSRLVREFVQDASNHALVARGRCLPYGEGITYWPVFEVVRDAAGLDDAATGEENLGRLIGLLEGVDDAEHVARQLGEVVGLVEQTSSAEETSRAVRTFVEAIARRRPLVLVFDDIHWGESTFLDLLDYVSDWTREAPTLLVCIARPELHEARPQWGGGKLNATSVWLEPLSEGETAQLVDNLAGVGQLEDEARRHVIEASSGNPLFVEEMLALMLEHGGDAAAFEVPETIHALLAARLDRLPDGERTTLEAASVEGKVFHETTAGELAGAAPDEVRRNLEALVRKELIRPDRPLFSGERAFTFRHLLIRDAAYAAMPKEARASFHERHASLLERRLGKRTLEFEEIIGYHLEQAFRYRSELGRVDVAELELGRRAADRLASAGRRAFARSDAPAGVNLMSRAVALLPPEDPLRVKLVPNVRAVQGLADLNWAERVLTEAVEAAATTGDRGLAAHALVQRGFLRLFIDAEVTPRELFDVSDRAIAVFEGLGDELGLARAWRLASQAHYLDGRPGLCRDASERALVHARRADDSFEEREIVEWLVIVLLLGPTPAPEAMARCSELLDQEWDDPMVPAEVCSAAAVLYAMQGREPEAEELIERARLAMSDAGEWIWIVSFWYGFIRTWHGDLAAAEVDLRPAYEALKVAGERSHFSSIAHSLSAVAYAQGRWDEAEQLTIECERACRPNDHHSRILWRSIRAKVLARRGEFDEANRLAKEALALAEAGDFLMAHADALMDYAEVLELAGLGDEAARALEEAIDLHSQKGNLVAIDVCRAHVASLREAGV